MDPRRSDLDCDCSRAGLMYLQGGRVGGGEGGDEERVRGGDLARSGC